MARYATLVPLGNLVVSGAGSTVLLSVNCGPLAGQLGAPGSNAGVPGTPLRQIILTNSSTTATAYLLPRGSVASSAPGSIIAAIMPGATIAIPYGQPFEGGILPENFCIDGSAAVTVYGCGILS